MELSIIMIYIYLMYNNNINFNKYLFVWCIFWLSLFLIYKGLNKVLKNMDKILEWIEKKERIKKFLLKPVVNKVIYYIMWSLPWNIMYWIYFWVMENGWYFRVWFSSNRDIFFWKYFKWDSRDFFFNFFEKINFVKKISYNIFEEVIKIYFRISYILSKIRKNMLNYSIVEYCLNRLIVFTYLSIFYLYFFEGIIIFNKYIMYIFIALELIFIIFCGYILKKILNNYGKLKENYILNQIIGIIGVSNIKIFINPIEEGTEKHIHFEINNTIWNIILGDSITLNILKKYMIWVNKNTKGYYYKEMEILVRVVYTRFINRNTIPWDILPNTRFVLFNLKYIQYSLGQKYKYTHNDKLQKQILGEFPEELNKILKKYDEEFEWKEEIPDFRLNKIKDIYLSHFEKTYSPVSVLCIQYLLRINYDYYLKYKYHLLFKNENFIEKIKKIENNEYFRKFFDEIHEKSTGIETVWHAYMIFLHKKNPKLFPIEYFLALFSKIRGIDSESCFMIYFLQEGSDKSKLASIPKKYVSLKEYKKNFKIVSKFIWYEEETVNWNNDLCEVLNFFYNNIIDSQTKICFFYDKISEYLKNRNEYGAAIEYEYDIKEVLIEYYMELFELKFNKDITLYEDFDFVDLHFMDNIWVEKWKFENWTNEDVLHEVTNKVELFEKMKKKNNKGI